MILSFWTDRFGQTVQTQIRLEEQSHQGLHCIFRIHYSVVKQYCPNFRILQQFFRVSRILGFLWYYEKLDEGEYGGIIGLFYILFTVSVIKGWLQDEYKGCMYKILPTVESESHPNYPLL